eukprot:7178265-Alexandrium_andersonii.AAC.1
MHASACRKPLQTVAGSRSFWVCKRSDPEIGHRGQEAALAERARQSAISGPCATCRALQRHVSCTWTSICASRVRCWSPAAREHQAMRPSELLGRCNRPL